MHLLIFDAFSSSSSKKSNCKISNTKSNCSFGTKNCTSKTGRKKSFLNFSPTKGIQKTPIGIIGDAQKVCHRANGKPRVMPAPTLYMYISAMGGFRGFASPFRHETPGVFLGWQKNKKFQWRENAGCVIDLAWLKTWLQKIQK